uniref:Uncharacterized protein n=1 Tax=Rhizophora mucronata TaxID=61149 RepID=A0A2P2R4P8_RHIMU
MELYLLYYQYHHFLSDIIPKWLQFI